MDLLAGYASEDSIDVTAPSHAAAAAGHAEAGHACSIKPSLPCEPQSGESDEEAGTEAAPAAKRARAADSTATATLQDDWVPPGLSPDTVSPFQDCPELHQGRKRTFPHVEGQYPTTVYIPVHLDEAQQQAVQQLVRALQQLLPGVQPMVVAPREQQLMKQQQQQQAESTDAGQFSSTCRLQRPGSMSKQEPAVSFKSSPNTSYSQSRGPPGQHLMGMHVSLSRTVPVRFAVLETLLGLLKEQLATACNSTFSLQLQGLRCFVNDEASRTFISVPVTSGQHQVIKAIQAVNRAFQVYELQPYYKDPQPHISIAWLLGSKRQEVEAAIQKLLGLTSHDERDSRNHVSPSHSLQCTLQYNVSCMHCRAGNREHILWTSKQ